MRSKSAYTFIAHTHHFDFSYEHICSVYLKFAHSVFFGEMVGTKYTGGVLYKDSINMQCECTEQTRSTRGWKKCKIGKWDPPQSSGIK